MAIINLGQMKTNEPTRNFDASVDGNVNIPAENGQGLFGAFGFFQGIKNFFKGISALGTLASGSRLPITDSNGNVTYTTMGDINNYVINNALTDYQEYKMQQITNGNANDCIPTNNSKVAFYRGTMSGTPFSNTIAVVMTSKYYRAGSYDNVYQEVEQYGSATLNYIPSRYIRYGYKGISETEYSWSDWVKITTESDLKKLSNIVYKSANSGNTFAVSVGNLVDISNTDNRYFIIAICGNLQAMAILKYNGNGVNATVSNFVSNATISSNGYSVTLNGDSTLKNIQYYSYII